jgi:hypothetical protein
MVKLLLATLFFAHGVGHVLFLGPALRLTAWADQTGQSWVLTPLVGDGAARILASVVWGAALLLFVGAAAGLVLGSDWWRAAAIAGAVVSAVGIVAMWGGVAPSSAIMALAFDVLVLLALLVVHWPSAEVVGS